MNRNKQKTYLTTVETAERLMVSTETVRQLAQKGKLLAQYTPGGHRRFLIKDVERYIRSSEATLKSIEQEDYIKILVVDDDISTVKLLLEFLSINISGAHLESATNGFSAGQKILSFKPDLVLVDIMMPGISGVEVCNLIKSNAETCHICIIAMTGFHSDDIVSQIIKAGASCCLAKPLILEDLLEKINSFSKHKFQQGSTNNSLEYN